MARPTHRPPTGHTILVVDDQEETLLSLKCLLEREGHRVLTADGGERALAILKEHDVHLILLDYVMPRMNGAGLVREVRSFDPYVQIILQTGYAGEKPPQTMLAELDIQGYHDKNAGPDELLMWVTVGLKAYKLIQRLRERERLQGELVANVSHELRTPLNIISGYAELLLDDQFGDLSNPARQPLRAIMRSAHDLTQLVSDFLLHTKAEAGVHESTEAPMRSADLARELRRLGEVLVEDKGIAFSVDTEGAPEAFLTDPVKARTILRNLITNAAKFTARGSIAVRVTTDEAGLSFTVADTGPGMRPEDLDIIFEPFRQLDSSATRAHGGVGLGLALSRKYARLLGGDLRVVSEVGLGSVFTLSLPAKPCPTERHQEPPLPRRAERQVSCLAASA
jgi:signal transduction histidine kinase